MIELLAKTMLLKACSISARPTTLVLFLVVSFFSTHLFAQGVSASAGEGEFAFLERYTSTRVEGLAGAGAASVEGLDALFLNPAGLAAEDRDNVAAMHYESSVMDEYEGILAWGMGFDSLFVALSLAYTNQGSVDEIDVSGDPTGKTHYPGNLVPAISMAGRYDAWRWGVSGKWVSENLAQTDDSQTALGWSTDAGVQYMPGPRSLLLSLSIRDFGRKLSGHLKNSPNQEGWLNGSARAALRYRVPALPRLMLMSDLEKPWFFPLRLYLATEYQVNPYLSVRGGFRRDWVEYQNWFNNTFFSGDESYEGGHWGLFSSGLSLQVRRVRLDYAVQVLRWELGVTHRLGLEVAF